MWKFCITITILAILLLPLTAMTITLKECNEQEIRGNYSLIVYSNSFINDPETFVVLDNSDDKVSIVPYAPAFKYKIFVNLSAPEALKIAHEILKNSAYVSSIKCSEIKDEENSVGYELKPIYFPWIWGVLESVETLYKKENSTVMIFIRLNPMVERQLNSGGDTDREN